VRREHTKAVIAGVDDERNFLLVKLLADWDRIELSQAEIDDRSRAGSRPHKTNGFFRAGDRPDNGSSGLLQYLGQVEPLECIILHDQNGFSL
jgi:hypothetical protein